MADYYMNRLFCYAGRSSASVVDGGSTSFDINIGTDATFLVKEVRTPSTDKLFITLKLNGSDLLSNISLNCALNGGGTNGLKLLDGYLIPRGAKITVTFDNSSGGSVAAPEVQLWGYKVN